MEYGRAYYECTRQAVNYGNPIAAGIKAERNASLVNAEDNVAAISNYIPGYTREASVYLKRANGWIQAGAWLTDALYYLHKWVTQEDAAILVIAAYEREIAHLDGVMNAWTEGCAKAQIQMNTMTQHSIPSDPVVWSIGFTGVNLWMAFPFTIRNGRVYTYPVN